MTRGLMEPICGGCVEVRRIVVGMLGNNVYFISDGSSELLVDPSCKAERILEAVGGRRIDAIVATHYHFDHVGAAREVRERTGAPLAASRIDAPLIAGERAPSMTIGRVKPCPVDRLLDDGDVVRVGAMVWRVISTPGHSPGSICLYLAPDACGTAGAGRGVGAGASGVGILIAGDTLFKDGIGRTDFEDGNAEDMARSLKRLAELPGDTIVLPGHGDPTTILAERPSLEQRW